MRFEVKRGFRPNFYLEFFLSQISCFSVFAGARNRKSCVSNFLRGSKGKSFFSKFLNEIGFISVLGILQVGKTSSVTQLKVLRLNRYFEFSLS